MRKWVKFCMIKCELTTIYSLEKLSIYLEAFRLKFSVPSGSESSLSINLMKLTTNVLPSEVMMLSGWNWTPCSSNGKYKLAKITTVILVGNTKEKSSERWRNRYCCITRKSLEGKIDQNNDRILRISAQVSLVWTTEWHPHCKSLIYPWSKILGSNSHSSSIRYILKIQAPWVWFIQSSYTDHLTLLTVM